MPGRRREGLGAVAAAPVALGAREALAAWRRAALPADFDARDAVAVARDLLGTLLLHRHDGGITGGRIVEVEAYLGRDDPASHAVVGRTARTHHLFGAPGTAYVYFIYGMHWCVNAVTDPADHGSAVLIRALAPVAGLPRMRARAGAPRPDPELCRGPGRLCRALGIDRALDGSSLVAGPLRIVGGAPVPDTAVRVTPRIGIRRAADWPLRFAVAGERAVSGPRRAVMGR